MGIKKKLDDVKGLWAEQLHEVIWSYHIAHQGDSIHNGDGTNVMLPIKIETPTSGRRS